MWLVTYAGSPIAKLYRGTWGLITRTKRKLEGDATLVGDAWGPLDASLSPAFLPYDRVNCSPAGTRCQPMLHRAPLSPARDFTCRSASQTWSLGYDDWCVTEPSQARQRMRNALSHWRSSMTRQWQAISSRTASGDASSVSRK